MDYAAYSTETPNRPDPRPNACGQCRAFKRVGEDYLPPSTHFWFCRHYIDQGVLRMAGPAASRQRTRGQQ